MSHLVTQPPAAEASLELVVRTRETSKCHPLEPGQVLRVGRGEDNAVRLDSPSVSRVHLQLHLLGEVVEVEDLGSSNGTVLIRAGSGGSEGQQERLAPHQRVSVRLGDALRVGPALLCLQQRRVSNIVPPVSARGAGAPPVLLDPAVKSAYELVTRAAATDMSVLILGETGVGKEAMAQTVHQRSPRRDGPFLLLNCAALSETLLESELFGHEKGAFTGALGSKAGLLESNTGGTVFLDEVGELALGTQAKLLRVLEERMVMRVGATKPRRIDVRFVTATNRDLAREVKAGRFRGDLYYRISGLVVRIPPLRDRPTELEPLAQHFLNEFCHQLGQPVPELTAAAVAALHAYDWPGNVRELKNVMERAVLLAGTGPIIREHVLPEPSLYTDAPDVDLPGFDDNGEPEESTLLIRRPRELGGPSSVPAQSGVASIPPDDERERFVRALELCGGNQTRAAQMLGVSRRTLINRLDRWKLPRPQKR